MKVSTWMKVDFDESGFDELVFYHPKGIERDIKLRGWICVVQHHQI